MVEAKLFGQGPGSHYAVERPAGEDADRSSPFDSKLHFMHGTLHANGFGHLDRMNARESSGPDRLTGQQLMMIWDSLCTLLAAREVSVEDVSNKSGMLLRMLHTSAYGFTWCG